MARRLRREDYTVGWICALPVELAAAQEMLDEEHDNLERNLGDNDENLYTLGSINGHNVAIVCLPAGRIGSNPAAAIATQLRATFKGLEFGLIVGIGGGVPSTEVDIRLGDVVVSKPDKTFGGVVQYDFGKATPSGFERTGLLNSPPQILLAAVASIQANEFLGRSNISKHITKFNDIPDFRRDKAGPDVLFKAAYDHKGGHTCDKCSTDKQETRQPRESGKEVVVHYGTIASGNKVIKNAIERDIVSASLGGILCFEMEAAGLMNSFPCLVIRGICDYADSHKNKKWQPYAAGTAAAYAKEVLSVIPPAVAKTRTAEETVQSACKRYSPSSISTSSKRRRIISSDIGNSIVEQQTVSPPTHYHERSQASLNEEQRQILLKSLKFDQINARQMTIRNAHTKTCRWLLRKPEYLNWLDTTKRSEHHGFLWIKGKPGTGKSTLMKFAFASARKKMKDRIVVAFFFNARGEEIEKSTIGTYQSLLLQLLEHLPQLQNIFDSLNLSPSNISADHRWSIQSLETLLEQAVQSLRETSVVCFIDALDECEEQQIRDMIRLFKRLGELVQSPDCHFQVCLSSRHYPHITIRKGLELVLEGQEGHTQDITNYLKSELEIGQTKRAQQLRLKVQEKASGIFMWVVLVVGILNKEYDGGRIHALEQRLQQIPSDLHELFRDILTRDSNRKGELILCIQWVLFAKQPLNPEQLYFALLSGVQPATVLRWDPDEDTRDIIKRFILDSSKGLTEITASKLPKVQFIHESVRDFFLKEDGLGNIWPESRSNLHGQSHERLKQCCLNYMSMEVFTTLSIPETLPEASTQEAADFRKSAKEEFPFLEYAVRNVLYHADVAAGYGMAQKSFIHNFPLERWTKYNNLVERYQVRRYKESVTLLYVAAEQNMANLISLDHLARSCLEVGDERYGTPLFASIACGSKEAIQKFEEVLGVDRSTRPHDEPSIQDYKDEDVQQRARRDFRFSRRRDTLSHAAELGNKRVFALLLKSGGFEVDAKDVQERTPLWWAAKSGNEAIAKLLLDTEKVDVDSKSKTGQWPLQIAASEGNKALVRMLVDKGADVNVQGGEYGNVLQAALAGSHEQIAKLLIDKGADVNARYGVYSNTLQAASARGHEQIAKLLIDKGVDINAQGGIYGNALQVASIQGHEQIAKLLIDKGAHINAQGGIYGNALQAALVQGHKQIAKLLIDKGANINAQGGEHGNALQVASARGHEQIAKLLIDKGANINAQGGIYGNALRAASVQGYEQIAKLLIDKGADVNAQSGEYGNALQAASVRGHEQIAKLLIDKGANINAQRRIYGNALQLASVQGHEHIVKLLIDKGADVNAQGGEHGNALQAASTRGHEQIVKLLINKGADVNAQGGRYGNALQVALRHGFKQIAKLLQENGAH